MRIVYVRAEQTALVPTGRHVMRDMNWFPEFKAEWEGKAGMWKWSGTEADADKARAWASKEGWTVLTFPADEKDPLGKARKIILQSTK